MRIGRRAGLALTALLAPVAWTVSASPAQAAQPARVASQDGPCTTDIPPAVFADAAEIPPVHATAVSCAAFYDLVVGRTGPRPDRYVFQPLRTVTRGQAATFVARTLQVAGYPLPDGERTTFTDLFGSGHEESIRRLAAAGLVEGTSATTYGPAGAVTRAQVATLLLRAIAYERQVALSSVQTSMSPFADIEDSVHRDNIGGLHALGLTNGTSATTFSPAAPVQRAQLASLVVRTLDAEAVALRACTFSGATLSYPITWQTNSNEGGVQACRVFDDEPVTLQPATELPTDVGALFYPSDATVAELERSDDVVSSDRLTVAGRAALRQTGTTTEDGLGPAGLPFVRIVLDLGDHRLVGETYAEGDEVTSFTRNAGVLTRMLLTASPADQRDGS